MFYRKRPLLTAVSIENVHYLLQLA